MVYQNQCTIPTLSPQALGALHTQYSRKAGHNSVDKLSQGERDVLDMAREKLAWVSITSLAHKYYPLYPNRQWWKRALERCSHQNVRTKTLNIVYLLRTLETIRTWALKAAFSGKEALNRLVHSTNKSSISNVHRLVQPGGIVNTPQLDRDPCTLVRWFRADEEHEGLRGQNAELACAASR